MIRGLHLHSVVLRWTGRVSHPQAGDEEPSCGYILAVPAIRFSGCVSRERSVASVLTRSGPWPAPSFLLLQLVFSLSLFRLSKLHGWFHNCAE